MGFSTIPHSTVPPPNSRSSTERRQYRGTGLKAQEPYQFGLYAQLILFQLQCDEITELSLEDRKPPFP